MCISPWNKRSRYTMEFCIDVKFSTPMTLSINIMNTHTHAYTQNSLNFPKKKKKNYGKSESFFSHSQSCLIYMRTVAHIKNKYTQKRISTRFGVMATCENTQPIIWQWGNVCKKRGLPMRQSITTKNMYSHRHNLTKTAADNHIEAYIYVLSNDTSGNDNDGDDGEKNEKKKKEKRNKKIQTTN